jgi:hypothetical protein
MPTKLVVALLGALLVFFGGIAVAKAATSAPSPGTWAAEHAAPLCDDRGASVYAAEPLAQAVDAGVIAQHSGDCRTDALLSADFATPSSPDDLQRTPPTARDAAVVPELPIVPPLAAVAVLPVVVPTEGARDGFELSESPPPRPVPWRS